MKSLTILSKKEMLCINGGSDAYDAGYKIGRFLANIIDWYEGFADGFNNAFK